jgi:tRNA(adenine34) deaminase
MRKYEFNYNICHGIGHVTQKFNVLTGNQKWCNMKLFSDEYFMNEALKEALRSLEKDEVPVGAVVVWNNRILARAHNLVETLNDPTAHAEMQAFTSATNTIGGKYLNECTLYVTLEPCPMCAGAAYWTQLGRIVYGADDEKKGYSLIRQSLLHPHTVVQGGVMKKECSSLIREFFAGKR